MSNTGGMLESIYQYIFAIYLPPFLYLSINLPSYLPIYLFIYLPSYPYTLLSINLFIYLPSYPSIYLYIYLPIYLYILVYVEYHGECWNVIKSKAIQIRLALNVGFTRFSDILLETFFYIRQ